MNTFATAYRQPRRKLNVLRIIVLSIAMVTGSGAAYLAASATPTVVQVMQAPSIRTAEVLVVRTDMKIGSSVHAADLRWQLWPVEGVGSAMITRDASPDAVKELEGALVKVPLSAGEAMRLDRVIRDQAGGLMAAMLPAGSRALAITIDNRGATSAGGFILPNDRVDVVKVSRDEAGSRIQGMEVMMSETILRNVRVLAVGRNIQDQNGERVSVAETATLELSPKQVEAVFLAQRTGQLTLSLRSIKDSDGPQALEDPAQTTVSVRYAGTVARRFNCAESTCSEGK